MGGRRTWRLAVPMVAALVITATCAVGGATADSPPTWTATRSPNRGQSTELGAISCVTADDCVAVGEYAAPNYRTVAQIWNGVSWSASHPRNVGDRANVLADVSCVTSTFCIAVGAFQTGTLAADRQPLAEVFDGAHWSRMHPPALGSPWQGSFDSISCVSTTWCIGVGSMSGSNTYASFIELWNGMHWARVTSAALTGVTELGGVSCASPSFCVTVGSEVAPSPANHSVAVFEMWDGATWSASPSATPISDLSTLQSVACPTATRCVAVGDSDTGPNHPHPTLVEIWDGTTWTAGTTPMAGRAEANALEGVSCADATDCVAVGFYDNVPNKVSDHDLIVSWDGSAWSILPSPGPGRRLTLLDAVSCPGPTTCRAVGVSYRTLGVDIPLNLVESPPAGA